MAVLKSTFAFVCFGMLLVGCTKNPSRSDYMQTMKRGLESVPHVQEIRAIFTNAPKSHFIEQLGFRWGREKKPAHWNTVVWFGGRYEFTYQVNVVPDYRGHTIDKAYGPKFYLNEVAKVTHDGRGAEFEPSGERVIGESEWKTIVAAKGDFSVIGIRLKTNAPVQGFDHYISAWRENTWAVRE